MLAESPDVELVDMSCMLCRGLAFRHKGRPAVGDKADPRLVILNDGTQPVVGTVMECGTCFEPLASNEVIPVGGWRKP